MTSKSAIIAASTLAAAATGAVSTTVHADTLVKTAQGAYIQKDTADKASILPTADQAAAKTATAESIPAK